LRWAVGLEEYDYEIRHRIDRKNANADCLSLPLQVHFDPLQPTILQTDASGEGLGAFLTQMHDGVEKVICFDSRRLDDVERRRMKR
jgi:hypothetical protein